MAQLRKAVLTGRLLSASPIDIISARSGNYLLRGGGRMLPSHPVYHLWNRSLSDANSLPSTYIRLKRPDYFPSVSDDQINEGPKLRVSKWGLRVR